MVALPAGLVLYNGEDRDDAHRVARAVADVAGVPVSEGPAVSAVQHWSPDSASELDHTSAAPPVHLGSRLLVPTSLLLLVTWSTFALLFVGHAFVVASRMRAFCLSYAAIAIGLAAVSLVPLLSGMWRARRGAALLS